MESSDDPELGVTIPTPRALAALRRSGGLTQSMPPQRLEPAQKACTDVMLIFAWASFSVISAIAPGRSSPWIRKPLFFLLNFSPEVLAVSSYHGLWGVKILDFGLRVLREGGDVYFDSQGGRIWRRRADFSSKGFWCSGLKVRLRLRCPGR